MAIILGVCGPSGSGKTTFAEAVADSLSTHGIKALILSMDDYYHDQSHLSKEERAKLNFDKPEAMDYRRFERDLYELEKGAPIQKPVYCFKEHRVVDIKWIHPLDYHVIIIEGLMLLTFKIIQDNIRDQTIYVDTPQYACFWRRLLRDRRDRGRTIWSILKQYFTMVLPGWLKHIEPYKYRARFRFSNSLDQAAHAKTVKYVQDRIKAQNEPRRREF